MHTDTKTSAPGRLTTYSLVPQSSGVRRKSTNPRVNDLALVAYLRQLAEECRAQMEFMEMTNQAVKSLVMSRGATFLQ